MERKPVTYWVNASQGEWGILEARIARKIRRRKGFKQSGISTGVRRWVDSFLEVLKRDGTVYLVEDKDEFEYIYRCLERLSIPLSYCPVDPGGGRSGSAGTSRISENRLAA